MDSSASATDLVFSVMLEVADIAKDLIELYARRKNAPGFAFTRDSFLQAELESSFIYEDTPDQAKATADVKEDMEQQHPRRSGCS